MAEETPKRQFTGFFIPVEILNDKRLSGTDKLLLAEIDALRGEHNEGCWASNAHLGRQVGVSAVRAKDIISKLRRLGYVHTVRTDGRRRWLRVQRGKPSGSLETSWQVAWKQAGRWLGNKHQDTSIDSKKKVSGRKRPAPMAKEAALLYGSSIGLTTDQVEAWWDYNEAGGWMLTRGKAIVSGEGSLRTWARKQKEFAARDATGAAAPLHLAGKTYAQLMDMAHERYQKLNTLNRNYGVNAPGAIARQRKQLTAELAQINAAAKEARKKEEATA